MRSLEERYPWKRDGSSLTFEQQHFVEEFMQVVNRSFDQFDTMKPDAINDFLSITTSGVSFVQGVGQIMSSGLSLVGVAAAIPTAGLSIAVAGATIATVQSTYEVYKFVRSALCKENTTFSSVEANYGEKRFLWCILLRELANNIAVVYAHAINTKHVNPAKPEISMLYRKELASFAAKRMMQIIIDFEARSIALKVPAMIAELYSTDITLRNITTEFPLIYARPKLMCYRFTSGYLSYELFDSSAQSIRNSWRGTVSKEYGYMALSYEDSVQYIRDRKLHKNESSELDWNKIQEKMSIFHDINRSDVEGYIELIKQTRGNQRSIKFNDFLKERLGLSSGITVIARCDHHNHAFHPTDCLDYADFSGVNFRRADLRGCSMQYSIWDAADLDLATFGSLDASSEKTMLQGARFNKAFCQRTVWKHVNFSNSSFDGACLMGAELIQCIIGNMSFIGMDWLYIELKGTVPPDNFEHRIEGTIAALQSDVEELKVQVAMLQNPSPISTPMTLEELAQRAYGVYRTQNTVCDDYIEPDVLPYQISGQDHRKPLLTHFSDFLMSPDPLLLLNGDVGGGKSSAGFQIQKKLWAEWEEHKTSWIPLLVELKNIKDNSGNFLDAFLLNEPYEYTPIEIECLKTNGAFVIILDGWDECTDQLAKSRLLDKCRIQGWNNVKVLITVRTEWLCQYPNYSEWLPLHMQCCISEFTVDQTKHYIKQRLHVESDNEYELLQQHSYLRPLLSSPLMLQIICEEDILSLLKSSVTSLTEHHRTGIYELVFKKWFEHSLRRLADDVLEVDRQRLILDFEHFTKRLAFEMFQNKEHWVERRLFVSQNPVISPEEQALFNQEQEYGLSELFNESDLQMRRKRSSCPWKVSLINGNKLRYEFIHKSFMEYAVAKRLFLSLHASRFDDWSKRYLTEAPTILSLLVEQIGDGDKALQERLLDLVKGSRLHSDKAIAASNAITCLNRLQYNFSKLDLNGISIPCADLSDANLAFVNLTRSNLQGVSFDNAILVGSNLSDSDLKAARFSSDQSVLKVNDRVLAIDTHANLPDLVAYTDGADVVVAQLSDGNIYARYIGHTGTVQSLSWSKNGRMLASGGFDAAIRIWDLTKQDSCLEVITGHKSAISSVAWSPKGTLKLASGSADGSIRIWTVDNTSNQYKGCILNQQNIISASQLAWSPDGTKLASGGDDGIIYVWNGNGDYRLLYKLQEHEKAVMSIVWISDTRLVSCALDNKICAWSTDNTKPVAIMREEMTITTMSHYGDRRVILGNHRGQITVLDVGPESNPMLTPTVTLSAHSDQINRIVCHNMRAVSCGNDGSVRLLNLNHLLLDTKTISTPTLPQTNKRINCVAWSSHSHLALGYHDGYVSVEKVDKLLRLEHTVFFKKLHNELVVDINWSNCTRWLATSSYDKSICILDMNSPDQLSYRLLGHDHWILKILWSPNRRYLASGSMDSTVKIWPVLAAGVSMDSRSLYGHTIVTSLAWSNDETQLATGGRDGSIRLWTVSSDAVSPGPVLQSNSTIENLFWRPLTAQIIAVGRNQTIGIWDINTRKCRYSQRAADALKLVPRILHDRYIVSFESKKMTFWDIHKDVYHEMDFSGVIIIGREDNALLILREKAIYLVGVAKNYPDKPQLTVIGYWGKSSFWVQGCSFDNVRGLSVYGQQLLRKKFALNINEPVFMVDQMSGKTSEIEAAIRNISSRRGALGAHAMLPMGASSDASFNLSLSSRLDNLTPNNDVNCLINWRNFLFLDLKYTADLNQEQEEAIYYKKVAKSIGVLLVCVLIGLVRGSPHYTNDHNRVLQIVYSLALVVIYGTESAWIYLCLEKEFLPALYSEQKISKETRTFKLLKHFSSIALSVIPSTQVSSEDVINALSIEVLLVTWFLYSIYFMRGYYFLFASKNTLMSYFSDKATASSKICHEMAVIVDDAMPTILEMSQDEMSCALSEMYNPVIQDKLSLPTLLNQLKTLNKPQKKPSSSLVFMQRYALKPMKLIMATLFTVSDTYDLYSRGTEAVGWFSVPPYFFMNLYISNEILERLNRLCSDREQEVFASHRYPRTFLASIVAYITVFFGLFLAFSVMYPTSNKNYGNILDNNFMVVYFFKDLLLTYIFSKAVLDALITNYIEIHGTSEEKNTIRAMSFLNYIKDEVIIKAEPEIVYSQFNTANGRDLLLKLDITHKIEVTNDTPKVRSMWSFFSKNHVHEESENNLRTPLVSYV